MSWILPASSHKGKTVDRDGEKARESEEECFVKIIFF